MFESANTNCRENVPVAKIVKINSHEKNLVYNNLETEKQNKSHRTKISLLIVSLLPFPFLCVTSKASSEANHFRIVLSFCLVSVVSEVCLHFCAK